MEKIILSVAIVVSLFGTLDFIIYAARSAPKYAVLGLWFWLLAFASLSYVAYVFLPL